MLLQQSIIKFPNLELEELLSNTCFDISDTGSLHSRLNYIISYTENEVPIVKPSIGPVPSSLWPFRLIKGRPLESLPPNVCPHHFVKDVYIEPLWSNFIQQLRALLRLGRTISPDFSILQNMTQDQKFFNDFRNKFLSALYQFFGIDVIAAPAWGDLQHIDRYMEGWPHGSLIAINSTGVCTDLRSRCLWLDGYHAMLDILHPSHIIRYGGFIEGENKEISTYFPNSNKKGVIYGI